MNPKVEELLQSAKKKEQVKRGEYLISLGLIDETRKVKVYYKSKPKSHTDNFIYDDEKKAYYKITDAPIDITDEEYAELCKYYSNTRDERANPTQINPMQADIKTIKNIMVFFTCLWAVGVIIWLIILLKNL